MKRIIVDVDRCSGCRLCEAVCSFAHENLFGSSASRITVVKDDAFGFDLPVMCWHCSRCLPMETCPSKALKRNPEGLIYASEECIGCGKCVETCLVGAIKLHPERHTPLICDQCGGKPICVRKCPTKALTYSETNVQRPKLPVKVLEETLRKWRIIA
ncbi:MAG: 4Fe-4S dicluster domain-containing protein [Candidatus Bathyarchaeia archaeon]